MELGVDKVFGLTAQGWQPHHTHTDPASGRAIEADFYIDANLAPDGVAHNIEVKYGEISQERERDQLLGYQARLERDERVTYITRAERPMSKDVRERIEKLQREYPDTFRVMEASEKAFGRIFDAGMRELVARERKRTLDHVARLPARERDSPAVEKTAREYLQHLNRESADGRQTSVEQIRFVQEMLRDLGESEHRREVAQATEPGKFLGLGYRDQRALTEYLRERAAERHEARMKPVDRLARHQIARERAGLAQEADRIQHEVEAARREGRQIDPRTLQRDANALGNTLGALQRLEAKIQDSPTREETPEQRRERQASWNLARHVRDAPIHRQLDRLDREAEYERHGRTSDRAEREPQTRRPEAERREREERELQRLAAEGRERDKRDREQLAAERMRWMVERGVDPEVAKIVGLNQPQLPPDAPDPRPVEVTELNSDHRARMQRARDRGIDPRGITRSI
ncbi:hypothetical protein IU487_33750 [Nocardia puris]|uniref:hypothetical protein n=1 Tax=Nocardia puris TaxID=208602 RepID=UPI001895E507|nr:hypothetical protein [Nocardia puris]MBF6215966.1 hypothetical protein [Nocardia puris]